MDHARAQTEAVLAHHLRSFAQGDLEAIVSDYAPDAVLCTPQGPLIGHAEIRGFFDNFITNLPHEVIVKRFVMNRQDIVGEMAYIVWSAFPIIDLGTDTFIIRDGKIQAQHFAANVIR